MLSDRTFDFLNSTHTSIKRIQIVQELFDSETRYENNLGILERHYHEPLLAGNIISARNTADIFGNIQDIQRLAARFRHDIESNPDRINNQNAIVDSVGKVFLQLAPFMKMYSLYVVNFRNAFERVDSLTKTNPKFKAFIKVIKKTLNI